MKENYFFLECIGAFPRQGKLKKHSFAFCKSVNHLKHINANKHFVLLSVFKCNVWPNVTLCAIYLKNVLKMKIFVQLKYHIVLQKDENMNIGL